MPRTSTMTAPASSRAPLPIADILTNFAAVHGRTLSPRGRRTVHEVVECLVEYLTDNGVTQLAKTGRGDAVSLAGLDAWIDAFERDELVDAVNGERDKLRVADAAIRALGRYLARTLD